MEKDMFAVKIVEDHGKKYLSVTHNGFQWNSFPIRQKDIPKIILVLAREYVEGERED
jgi:hypothetical protein